ncbi:hypothetical protein BU17DRAFT_73948 [Hysterangium stoloniferum]|nr:hypothetical protein BU17DRAFT_73948 [Hysterangium stoloniferum]
MASSGQPKAATTDLATQPRISLNTISAPAQRLYILSLGALLQAFKARSFLLRWWYPEYWWRYLFSWVALDALFILGMAELRIPRLAFGWKARLMQLLTLALIDVALFKPYDVMDRDSTHCNGHGCGSEYLLMSISVSDRDAEISTREKTVYVDDVINQGGHLFGQHTVRLSPISTAKLNPFLEIFCLEAPHNTALIPVVFNNTQPTHVTYSVSALGNDSAKTFISLSSRDLKQIEKARSEALTVMQMSDPGDDGESEDDYYDQNDSIKQRPLIGRNAVDPAYQLEKTEILQHIKITRPGVVRLERALDQNNADVRIRPTEVTIVQCPKVEFVKDTVTDDGKRCIGTTEVLNLNVFGVAPLTLKWHREVSGRRENFLVEGIEGDHNVKLKINNIHTYLIHKFTELRIPLTMQLDALGPHTYSLDALTDGVGNSLDLATLPPSTKLSTSQTVTVIGRSAMSFKSCGPGRPASLLIGKDTPLFITANDADAEDGPWYITVRYKPPLDDKKKYKPWQQDFRSPLGKRDLTLLARAPGEYTIVGVKGKYCPGDVLSPESCRVIEQPLPTAEIEWKRIHECSGDTGVSVSLMLQGKPPFKIFYSTKRDGEATRELHQMFYGSRGEITLQPERSGTYTYTFLRMSDANYEDIKLDGPVINQIVHPLAGADFVKSGQLYGKQGLHSCSGSMVDIDVDLKGTPPWNLEVQILGPKGSQNVNVSQLKNPRETLRLPIPAVIDEEGGTFQVDLVSVEDAYGCKRQLSVPGVSVNVKRVKPTAKFYAQDGKRQMTILQGKRALLPLRLTGDAPWSIRYHRADEPEAGEIKVSLSTANDHITVTDAGLYEILGVRDAYCPGSVISGEHTFLVDWVPKPTVQLANTTTVVYVPVNGTYVRPGVCEGTDDHVDLMFHGTPPFQINYNVARDFDDGGMKLTDQPTFSSIQPSGRFQLQTSKAGRVYYEVQAIGDASYPIQKHANNLPLSKRLRFEQQIFPRPAAYFKRSNRISFCLNDPFVPRDEYPMDGTIMLHGIPPFTLELSIKNLASSEIYKEVIETSLYEWTVDMPHYNFRTVGPHVITIDSVRDASNCPESDTEMGRRSQWIDVAETAVIVPFDRREDYCVGEALQFQLEGSPPWRVQYRFDGKLTSALAPTSPFRRVADRAGVFSIISVAHEQDMCQNTVTDLSFRIHNIPSAKVSHGKKIVQDIREGDQAEIHFELIGEPPFTFTYQRTELASNPRRGQTPKVLETHTVSGINTRDYSIYSASEGTWTVSFIQDRHCRYPPIQADKSIENA